MTKLENCPCCDGEAKLMKSNILKLGYEIRCSNETDCGLYMAGEVYNNHDDHTKFLTLKQIVKRWNTRI